MKKCVYALAVAALLALPLGARAEKTMGVYVAPKLLFSQQIIESPQIKNDFKSLGYSSTSYMIGNEKSESSWGGALALGYDFNPKFDVPIRTELEYAARSQSKASWSGDTYTAKVKFDVQTLFVNVYYDIKTSTAFTPYFGAGLGVAFIKSKAEPNLDHGFDTPTTLGSSSKSQSNFAWNVGAGIAYAVSDNWDIDLGYRYVDMGEVKTGSVSYQNAPGTNSYQGKAKLRTHEVMLGVRYTF